MTTLSNLELAKQKIWADALNKPEHSSVLGVSARILGGKPVGCHNWYRVKAALSSLSPNWAQAIHASLNGKGRILMDTWLIDTDQFGNFNENEVRCTGYVSRATDFKRFKNDEREEFSKFLKDKGITEFGKEEANVMFKTDGTLVAAGLYTDGENPWTINQDEEGNLVVTKTINKELDNAIQTASVSSGHTTPEGIMNPVMANDDVGVITFLDYDEVPKVGVAYKAVANTKNRVSVMREESFEASAENFKPVDISVDQVIAYDPGDPEKSPFYQPIDGFVNKINSGELVPTDEFAKQLASVMKQNLASMPVTAAMTDTLLTNGKVNPGDYYAYIYRKYKDSPELQNMINYARKIMSGRSMATAAAKLAA